MSFKQTKNYSARTRIVICLILAATLFIIVPNITFAQVVPLCADGTPATRNAIGMLNSCPDGSKPTGATEAPPTPTSCASVTMYVTNLGDCLVRSVVTFTVGSLIYISTWLLAAAAALFNWLMDYTIIKFGAFYSQSVKTAVETAWTAFRDIANIFIIGIFTYIAINIILGAKEFGQKKMIASVLIVAVLINFSLLFTKMVIDVSNYTAAQIYTAAALGGTATAQGGQAGAATAGTSYGIAEQFMNLLDVQTFGKALKLVDDTAEAKDSGWVALLHGILVMAVVLGAAMVLFYGCFLLISRMIMLIFLMVTAAVAVASYLIPDWGTSNYGFKAWKSSLIWCATFAPMLMIFLWMTLNVSYALKGKSNATLGAALANPVGGDNIGALFNYVMILGLLFTTFKLSSMWASKIGGFSWAAAPLTNAFRVAGLGMRLGIGIPAYKYAKSLTGGARKDRDDAAKAEIQARRFERLKDFTSADQEWAKAKGLKESAASKMRSSLLPSKLADSRFNLMDTAGAKAVLGAAGIKGLAGGESSKLGIEKSVTDRIKMRTEAAEKMAAKLAPSAGQNEEARVESRRVVREQRQLGLDQLEATRSAEKASADAMKDVERLPQRLATAQQTALAEKTDAEAKMTLSAQKLQAGTIPQAQHAAEMASEKQRIEQAKAVVNGILQRINTLDRPVKEVETKIRNYETKTENIARAAGTQIVDAMRDSALDISEQIGAKQGDIITRNTIGRLGENKAVKEETKSLYRKKLGAAKFRDAWKLTQEEEGGGNAAAAAPAAEE